MGSGSTSRLGGRGCGTGWGAAGCGVTGWGGVRFRANAASTCSRPTATDWRSSCCGAGPAGAAAVTSSGFFATSLPSPACAAAPAVKPSSSSGPSTDDAGGAAGASSWEDSRRGLRRTSGLLWCLRGSLAPVIDHRRHKHVLAVILGHPFE